MDIGQRIRNALSVAEVFGLTEGDHHRAWVIDQMVRALCGSPNTVSNILPTFDECDEYRAFVDAANDGEDGPNTYEWNVGIAP